MSTNQRDEPARASGLAIGADSNVSTFIVPVAEIADGEAASPKGGATDGEVQTLKRPPPRPSGHEAKAHASPAFEAERAWPHPPRAGDDFLPEGSRVSHFRVVAPLGRGGMGAVYRAVDESLRREVALKVLLPIYLRDTERRLRFLREARAAAAVNHPNIATIHEVGETDGWVFIAMELIEGESLRELLAARRLSVDEATFIARQVLRGLEKAHGAGLVHRDLKPDNVMLTPERLVKVLDFGLAKQRGVSEAGDALRKPPGADAASDPDEYRTLSGTLLGTPRYMSPEQARGAVVDHRSDVFSFGVLLYEMLAGDLPFAARTVVDLLAAVIHDKPAPLLAKNPEVSQTLWRLVERCLAKDPADRYQDCATLARELEQIAPAASPGGRAPSGASGAQGLLGASSESSVQRRARRRRLGIAAALTAALAAVASASGAALYMRHRSAEGAPKVQRSTVLSAASASGVAEAPSGMPKAGAPSEALPAPTAITDLAPPASGKPEAITAYKAALQSFRDSNWELAAESLRRALSLDPAMPLAHLRLAMSERAGRRDSFIRAAQGRAALGERDQALLTALEPWLARDDPGEHSLVAERLRAVTARYPGDAELWNLLAYNEVSAEGALAAARRAAELDPRYADAWQIIGDRLASLGKAEEAQRALDRCMEISAVSVDCRAARARQDEALGRCADMEEDYRRAIAGTPKAPVEWYAGRAAALYALGRPRSGVLEVLTQKWAQMPERDRRLAEIADRAWLEIDAGHFGAAEDLALRRAALLQGGDSLGARASQAELMVRIDEETGRPEEAAKAASDFLQRLGAWGRAAEAQPVAMQMLRVMLHAGAISPASFAERRRAFLAEAASRWPGDAFMPWLYGYASFIETPEEAAEALSNRPKEAAARAEQRKYRAALGEMYRLAGALDEALPLLHPENGPCLGPAQAISVLPLAKALEQKGDKPSACAAYAKVLARWGNASPRSVSAETARARVEALGCALPTRAVKPSVPALPAGPGGRKASAPRATPLGPNAGKPPRPAPRRSRPAPSH